MIQDIFPHQFSNKFQVTTELHNTDFLFHFRDNTLLLYKKGDQFSIPRRSDFDRLSLPGIFLFTLNNCPCFLISDCEISEKEGLAYHDISFFRSISQKDIAWASIVAQQLANWYAVNRYCGKCGTPLLLKTDERAMICPVCNHTIYPKISPAIIVAIVCGDKILLARGIQFRSRFYSLVAGYADIGESLEETVVREVKEEVGLDVKNVRYYKSQPWPVSGSMMIGFVAEADENQPIQIDQQEISEASWFSRDSLPAYPPSTISIAGEMIEKFKTGQL